MYLYLLILIVTLSLSFAHLLFNFLVKIVDCFLRKVPKKNTLFIRPLSIFLLSALYLVSNLKVYSYMLEQLPSQPELAGAAKLVLGLAGLSSFWVVIGAMAMSFLSLFKFTTSFFE